eukprot:g61569.t1
MAPHQSQLPISQVHSEQGHASDVESRVVDIRWIATDNSRLQTDSKEDGIPTPKIVQKSTEAISKLTKSKMFWFSGRSFLSRTNAANGPRQSLDDYWSNDDSPSKARPLSAREDAEVYHATLSQPIEERKSTSSDGSDKSNSDSSSAAVIHVRTANNEEAACLWRAV